MCVLVLKVPLLSSKHPKLKVAQRHNTKTTGRALGLWNGDSPFHTERFGGISFVAAVLLCCCCLQGFKPARPVAGRDSSGLSLGQQCSRNPWHHLPQTKTASEGHSWGLPVGHPEGKAGSAGRREAHEPVALRLPAVCCDRTCRGGG
jgi:hypothetical protein